jgi:RNA polymerase sigma factor (sigma-70 family)
MKDVMSADPPATYSTRATLLLRLNTLNAVRSEIAWQEFHARYAPVVAGFARNMGARPQEVDDVIQDVMLGFYAHAPTFVYDPAKGRFRGYLKVCAFRALRDRLRNNAKFKTLPLEQVPEDDAQVEELWSQNWAHELLNRATQNVRTVYANNNTFRAFEMHVLQARPVDDVAAALNMSEASVYKAKQRVTAAIHREFKTLQDQEG